MVKKAKVREWGKATTYLGGGAIASVHETICVFAPSTSAPHASKGSGLGYTQQATSCLGKIADIILFLTSLNQHEDMLAC